MGEENQLFEMMEEEEMDFEAMLEECMPYTVFVPEEYREKKYTGNLKGYYIEETRTFNVVPKEVEEARKDCAWIGRCDKPFVFTNPEPTVPNGKFVVLTWNDPPTAIEIKSGAEVQIEYYSLKKEVFSRNQGILESDQMKDRQAVIPGVGSGGSFVALELAKAGIGSLILADDDRFAYHNICRHQCGIHDVGKYKVDALAERIADINPYCKVYTFRDMIQHVDPEALKEALWEKSIIVCCTDNRHAGYV